jgi:hypothetical protein
VNIQADYGNRLISPQEQELYDHLLSCIYIESPEALVDRFRLLFIEGTGYPDRDILNTLDQILLDKQVDLYFRHVLNRCCHILINRWQSNRHSHESIAKLVNLFEAGPHLQVREVSRSRSVRRLREVVSQFQETDQYVMLQRLVRVIEESYQTPVQIAENPSQPLGTLIGRYPYLYEHCLLNDDSPSEHQYHVRRIQGEVQHRFELDLSHYVNYRVRRARMKRDGTLDSLEHRLRPANNPTLLNDKELVTSLRQFSGKVEHQSTYQDLAQRFMTQNCQAASFKAFKDDLYGYITTSTNSDYGKRKFNDLLYHQLQSISPESEAQPINDFLMVRTCSQLFNFLVVDNSSHRQHFVFIDLINNLGPIATTGILLKILLLCRKVKPYLERRFSLLFSHYETTTQDTVSWLIKVLENLNVALSLNFGQLDLSHLPL